MKITEEQINEYAKEYSKNYVGMKTVCLVEEYAFKGGMKKAISMLQPEWIRVTDAIPSKKGYYLGVNDLNADYKIEIVECYENLSGNSICLTFQSYVTHWIPLPEPPKLD